MITVAIAVLHRDACWCKFIFKTPQLSLYLASFSGSVTVKHCASPILSMEFPRSALVLGSPFSLLPLSQNYQCLRDVCIGSVRALWQYLCVCAYIAVMG